MRTPFSLRVRVHLDVSQNVVVSGRRRHMKNGAQGAPDHAEDRGTVAEIVPQRPSLQTPSSSTFSSGQMHGHPAVCSSCNSRKTGGGAPCVDEAAEHLPCFACWSPNFDQFWTPKGLRVTSSATWKSASIFVGLCFFGVCLGGPGEIRTHDLFDAMVMRSITYGHSDQKQKTCASGIWTPFGLR